MKFSLRSASPEPRPLAPAEATKYAALDAWANLDTQPSAARRFADAAFILTTELLAQRRCPRELRNQRLIDLCLDLRNALMPLPPLDDPSVPVIPGRSA